MASREVLQELELFDQTISILEQSSAKDDAYKQKILAAKNRLRSRVSLQDTTRALEDANQRSDNDDRRIAQRALSALLDSLPQPAALDLIKKGFGHPDASTRASAVAKLVDAGVTDEDSVSLICSRLADVDTKVSKPAIEFVRRVMFSDDATLKNLVDQKVQEILAGRIQGGALSTDLGTTELRIWELAADMLKSNISQETENLSLSWLRTLFTSLETWNDDVLFVLNQLEIAASLPRKVFHGKSSKLCQVLIRYGMEQDMVADDALRVLAALHYGSDNATTRPQFFDLLNRRMSQEFFSLGSLEIFAMFIGSSSEAFSYVLDSQSVLAQRWLSLVTKFLYDGNEVPRNVALDALSRALRGGSLLKDPLVPTSNVYKDDSQALAEAEASSLLAWRFIREELPNILKSITTAIRSLHPQVQLSAYQTLRILLSQNSRWGIHKVFEHIPAAILLAGDMPSPNASHQCVEARKSAIAASAVKFLDDKEDAQTLRDIKQFIQASADGAMYRLHNPSVDVATMRA